jgi:hypothetical protein
VEDDSPTVLLRFYGPMFLVWSTIAFNAARGAGRWRPGIVAGMVVAFATFAVVIVVNFLRVNLFLHELVARGDWEGLMARFRASGMKDFGSSSMLTTFVRYPSSWRRPRRSGRCSVVSVERWVG